MAHSGSDSGGELEGGGERAWQAGGLSGIRKILEPAASARFGALRRAVAAWRASLARYIAAIVVEPFVTCLACGCTGEVVERAGRTSFTNAAADRRAVCSCLTRGAGR